MHKSKALTNGETLVILPVLSVLDQLVQVGKTAPLNQRDLIQNFFK